MILAFSGGNLSDKMVEFQQQTDEGRYKPVEKKTIGKFISALRRANGMTQKELGEKLFVSDKTVSRWECDESTPELSLIPVIAEIFGITTDELLRGERNNQDKELLRTEEDISKEKAKSDKQFNRMLDLKSRKYKNLTLISFGITFLGIITAAVINLGFSKGLIAFCVATVLFVTSEICQICFTINARITPDEDDDTYTEKIQKTNTSFVKTAVIISFLNIAALFFCLPLVTLIDGANFGLVFTSWLGYGLLFSAFAFLFFSIVYALFIRKALADNGIVTLDENHKEKTEKKRKLLHKILIISLSIFIVLYVALIILNSIDVYDYTEKILFDTCEEFKAFVENDYDKWYAEGYEDLGNFEIDIEYHLPETEDTVILTPNEIPGEEYELFKEYEKIYSYDGELICEYYYNPNLYEKIIFGEHNDKTPITVVTSQAYHDAWSTFNDIRSWIEFFMITDILAAVAFYFVMAHKINKKFK